MDVKSEFRQIGLDQVGATAFGYVLAGYVVVDTDTRLQFGRESPGWWGVMASETQDAQRKNDADGSCDFGGRAQTTIA